MTATGRQVVAVSWRRHAMPLAPLNLWCLLVHTAKAFVLMLHRYLDVTYIFSRCCSTFKYFFHNFLLFVAYVLFGCCSAWIICSSISLFRYVFASLRICCTRIFYLLQYVGLYVVLEHLDVAGLIQVVSSTYFQCCSNWFLMLCLVIRDVAS